MGAGASAIDDSKVRAVVSSKIGSFHEDLNLNSQDLVSYVKKEVNHVLTGDSERLLRFSYRCSH
jgi:hypothetical protein